MIYNRYVGIRKYFMRGKILRNALYLFMRPIQISKAKKILKDKPLFASVEIETINRCNGVCPFCPINHNVDTREFAKMEEGLFKKIIDQLSELKYSGRLALFSNNEPFLDTRIIDFAKYARLKCPNAFIYIYTNGTILTEEKLLAILPYLDQIVIDNYNDDLQLNESSVMANKLCKINKEYDRKIQIHLRKLNEVLYTRGGQAPNNQQKKEFKMPCMLPLGQLIIRPTGEVSLCCNDALGKYTLGDCNNQSLTDIWYSEQHLKICKSLSKGRSELELCKNCDTFSF